MEPLFGLIFLLFFGVFVAMILRGIADWGYNNAQPVQNVRASVVTKRTDVSSYGGDRPTDTTYFCTFELEDGQRREFKLRGTEYGLLAEGDQGLLHFQGTRYKGFDR